MSIRFHCDACRTVLKIESMIAEEKKVRCTTCGIVILISPDPSAPNGLKTAIPDTTGKASAKSRAEEVRQKRVLFAALGGIVLVALVAFLYFNRPPGNRAAIEGEVLCDGAKLEKGTIVFLGIDDQTISAKGDIVDGKYRITRRNGPGLGKNKVCISSQRLTGKATIKPGETVDTFEEGIADEFSGPNSILEYVVVPGSNSKDFEVKSKKPGPPTN